MADFSGYVFKTDDSRYRMIYFGSRILNGEHVCMMAVSDDGVHFVPEDTTDKVELEDRFAPHELFKLPNTGSITGSEIADVYEDLRAEPQYRYKMLLCGMNSEELKQENLLYTSPDLYHWTLQPEVCWGVGNKPLADVFYFHTCITI